MRWLATRRATAARSKACSSATSASKRAVPAPASDEAVRGEAACVIPATDNHIINTEEAPSGASSLLDARLFEINEATTGWVGYCVRRVFFV